MVKCGRCNLTLLRRRDFKTKKPGCSHFLRTEPFLNSHPLKPLRSNTVRSWPLKPERPSPAGWRQHGGPRAGRGLQCKNTTAVKKVFRNTGVDWKCLVDRTPFFSRVCQENRRVGSKRKSARLQSKWTESKRLSLRCLWLLSWTEWWLFSDKIWIFFFLLLFQKACQVDRAAEVRRVFVHFSNFKSTFTLIHSHIK